jgi:type IV fimbrial biogenesis protein FimT
MVCLTTLQETQSPLFMENNIALFKAKHHGFTLTELMVTVAIVAILAAIAVPNFSGLFADLALRQHTSSLLDDLRLARSTATKRGVTVSICASSNAQDVTPACQSADVDWSQGWIIYIDNTNPINNTFDADTDELIYRQESLTNSGGVKTGAGGVSGAPPINVRFNPDGRTPGQFSRFEFKSGNNSESLDRSVCLATTGRARVNLKTGVNGCS